MLIKKPETIRPSEITRKEDFLSRRKFIRGSIHSTLALSMLNINPFFRRGQLVAAEKLDKVVNSPFSSTDEDLTKYKAITSYNNFAEFGIDKEDPSRYAGQFNPRPWSISVQGECNRPGEYDLDDIIKPHQLEERIYRLRCVEAWSMVIPWVGIPLADILKRFQPNSNAKYVAFTTIYRPDEMPGQRTRVLKWPYVEGLRIDEAVNPLTILAVGLYGEELLNQNGAPIRLVVPWKYGFKSIKSINKIWFTDTQPPTSWNIAAPREYGFYSNVNPEVNHPRWSQNKERRIGKFLKQDTLMFNGYADQVASMYAGMDLRKSY